MIDTDIADSRNLTSSNRLVSITDAARFLGYKTNRPITKMIQSKILPTYVLPDSKRRRVKISELLNLVKIIHPLD
jgi:hypothetical protein